MASAVVWIIVAVVVLLLVGLTVGLVIFFLTRKKSKPTANINPAAVPLPVPQSTVTTTGPTQLENAQAPPPTTSIIPTPNIQNPFDLGPAPLITPVTTASNPTGGNTSSMTNVQTNNSTSSGEKVILRTAPDIPSVPDYQWNGQPPFTSPNGRYNLQYRNGSLQLYDGQTSLASWAIPETTTPIFRLMSNGFALVVFDRDGNFSKLRYLMRGVTNNIGYMTLSDDGKLRIYSNTGVQIPFNY